MPNVRHHNPFGVAQSGLINYILKHPRCSFENIHQDEFPDKTRRYLGTLLHENRDLIEKTESADPNFPTEYRIKIAELGKCIDVKYWVETGRFKKIYKQGTLFNDEGVPYIELPRTRPTDPLPPTP